MSLVDPTERFAALVERGDEAILLDEAALCIAAHARDGLDVDEQRSRLDGFAAGVGEPTLDGVLRHVFGELGFSGEVERYGEPDSSFLDSVLDRRRGIPISLAIVLLEVARRVDVPLDGVGMPGHFLVRDRVDPQVFVDPFARGALLDAAACRAIFARLHPNEPFEEHYLDPVGSTAILARVLTNLTVAYRRAGDRAALTWVLRLRCMLPGTPESFRRELAVLLSAGGQYDEAADQLDVVGDANADHTAARLRAKLN